MSSALSAVILDCGGVLGLPQDPERAAAMADLCGLSMKMFRSLYGRDRLELDRGTLSMEEYWSRILRAAGITSTPELIERIEEHDAVGWTGVNQKVVDWSRELRAAGWRTAILSNMPPNKLSYMRASGRFDWIDEFPVAIFSCDCALVKPEPAIYHLCLEKLGARPEECLFLDDMPANIEAARTLGINALLFSSPREAAKELRQRWELPVKSLEDRHD
ncbi:MAG: HAD family phosphatase [Spirochaetia bacterium]|jgi:putative hydrolase of the HAD superfamily